MAFTFLTLFLTSKTDKYLFDWILAGLFFFISSSFGYAISIADSPSPILPAIANSFYIAAHAAILSGTSVLLGGKHYRLLVLIMFLGTLALHQVPFLMSSVENRLLTTYPIIIALNIVTTIALLKNPKKNQEGKAYWLLIVTLLFFAIQLLLRGGLTLSHDLQLALIGSDFIQTSGNLFLIFFLFLLTISCTVIVTWRKELKLRRFALTDELTGWLNRKSLDTIANSELLKSKRTGASMSMIMIDIDNFKSVNDKYGHLIGDKAIQLVCDLARQLKREYDHHFRIGGEEFVIVLTETSLAEAQILSERIRQKIAGSPLMVDNIPINLTVSIGLAISQPDDENWRQILERADSALYKSKATGRNKVTFEFSVESI
jgi:diguanylate cyclase (GGDEF)-like protein